MILDNGAANRQADPHAASLGRVKSIEQAVGILRIESRSCVLHSHTNLIIRFSLGSDDQLPRTIFNISHRV